jgi:hypothetical protein
LVNAHGYQADVAHWSVDELLDQPFDPAALISTVERISAPATVAQAVYRAFDDRQGVTSNPDKKKALTCTLRNSGSALSRTIPFTQNFGNSICGGFISAVEGTMKNNINTVTPALSADEAQAVDNALMAVEVDPLNPSGRVFKNFRCNPAWPDGTPVDPDPSQGVCEVVARAKRVNAYPNALELVFFDDEREVTAEGYALFLVLGGDAGAIRGNALCNRVPVSGGARGARPFDWVYKGSLQ